MARIMKVEGFSEALIREDDEVRQFFLVLVSYVGSGAQLCTALPCALLSGQAVVTLEWRRDGRCSPLFHPKFDGVNGIGGIDRMVGRLDRKSVV